jgi:protein-glutamine gamma-glutamyltransferase
MPLDRAFRLSVYVVVALGALALGAGHLLGPAALVAFLGVLAATWWLHDALGPRAWLTPTRDKITAISLAAIAAVDLAWFAESLLDTFARLVCILLLVRLATWRVTRELRAAGFLSFSMLAAASAVAFGVAFLPLFVTYLATAIVMLVLFHLVTEAEAAGTATRPLGLGLAVVVAVAVVGTLGLTVLLFTIIPRVEAALPFGGRSSKALTGFTDRVELGAFGTLELDDAVAMRVRLPAGPVAAELEPFLRWRGVTLDRFDGRVWSAGTRRQMILRASDGIPVGLGRVDRPVALVTQEVFLEPIGTDTIFALSPPVRITVDGTVRIDDTVALSVPAARARLTYTAESALGARLVERLGPIARARYLQLPELPPRIPELARRITAGATTPAEQAGRLTAWLSRELRYSLELEQRTTLEPLEEFLFVRRAGNCEYFAAALAVMLRTLDVPARVVNGFQRGEWNPYGEYWVVRMRDAHSWVEANLDGAWTTLDPSPRGAAPPAPISALTLYIDGLRMRWYRYVVGWSRQDQLYAASAVRRLAWSWPMSPRLSGPDAPRGTLVTTLLGVVAVGMVVWGVQHARRGRRARTAAMPDFYVKALARLARRGLRPAPSETAREFSRSPVRCWRWRRGCKKRRGRTEGQELLDGRHLTHRRAAHRRDPCPAPYRVRAARGS